MMKEYTSAEFTKKLFEMSEMRRSPHQDIRYSAGDKIYYQSRQDKAWYGPVKVVSHDSNSVFVLDRNTLKKLNSKCCMPYDDRQTTLANTHTDTGIRLDNTGSGPVTTTLPSLLDLEIPDAGLEATDVDDDLINTQNEEPVSKRTRSNTLPLRTKVWNSAMTLSGHTTLDCPTVKTSLNLVSSE